MADERALGRMPGRARGVTYGSIESFRSNNFLHLANALRRVCTPDPGDERISGTDAAARTGVGLGGGRIAALQGP